VIFLGILGKLLFRIPLIAVLRDIEPYDSLFVRGLVNNKFIKSSIKVFIKSYGLADAIVTVCPGQVDTLNHFGIKSKRIEMISRSISLKNFEELSVYKDDKINLTGNNIIKGLYIGTFGKCHSLPELISSLISPPIIQLPIDFVFVGDGEDRIRCDKLIHSSRDHRVSLYHAIPFEGVPWLLQNADFLIYSENVNRLDTLGTKFYEYLASAKPVLICGRSQAAKILKEIQNGWCIDTYDVEILYGCLQMIVSERLKFGEIGMKGRIYISNYEQNNFFLERWINLCNSLIRKST
jgi:glycosyltransferase involved in cell wall biosynthesis